MSVAQDELRESVCSGVRLIHGDCTEVMARLEPESIDCIVTDPPYGETSLHWDQWPKDWPAVARRILKPTGSMWVFGSQRMFWEHRSEFSGWNLSQDIIWEKQNGGGLANDRFRRVHESALLFYRDDANWRDVYKSAQFTNDAVGRTVRKKAKPSHWIGATGPTVYRSEDGGPRLMRSVIYARNEHRQARHPTQKPIAIVEPLLLYACPPDGHVLDPFAGSGVVGVLARRHGMKATLIEAADEYLPIIESRLSSDAPLFEGCVR